MSCWRRHWRRQAQCLSRRRLRFGLLQLWGRQPLRWSCPQRQGCHFHGQRPVTPPETPPGTPPGTLPEIPTGMPQAILPEAAGARSEPRCPRARSGCSPGYAAAAEPAGWPCRRWLNRPAAVQPASGTAPCTLRVPGLPPDLRSVLLPRQEAERWSCRHRWLGREWGGSRGRKSEGHRTRQPRKNGREWGGAKKQNHLDTSSHHADGVHHPGNMQADNALLRPDSCRANYLTATAVRHGASQAALSTEP